MLIAHSAARPFNLRGGNALFGSLLDSFLLLLFPHGSA
jgi:hypothetical protein